MTHGYGKFTNMMQGNIWERTHLFFSAEITMALVIFAELFCAFFVLIGFGTRIFSIPVMYNFIIAITVAHAADTFGMMEKAVLFLRFLSLKLNGFPALLCNIDQSQIRVTT